jgi:hypothetical protein
MDAKIIAGLVREQSPDHAGHVDRDALQFRGDAVYKATEGTTTLVRCSCGVGLTLRAATEVETKDEPAGEAPAARRRVTVRDGS